MKKDKKIILFGFGYWGQKIYATLAKIVDEKSIFVYDPKINKEKSLIKTIEFDQLVSLHFTHAFIATPEETHYEIVKKCLDLKMNVFVEKPLCLKTKQAKQLQEIAAQKKLSLFVDYTFNFDSAVQKITKIIEKNKNNPIFRIESIRHSINIYKPKVDVFADLATHDIYLFKTFFNKQIKQIETIKEKINSKQVNQGQVLFQNGKLLYQCQYSWAQPVPQRKMTIFFSDNKTLVWDKNNTDLLMYQNQKLVKKYSLLQKKSPLELSIRSFIKNKEQFSYINDVEILEKISSS